MWSLSFFLSFSRKQRPCLRQVVFSVSCLSSVLLGEPRSLKHLVSLYCLVPVLLEVSHPLKKRNLDPSPQNTQPKTKHQKSIVWPVHTSLTPNYKMYVCMYDKIYVYVCVFILEWMYVCISKCMYVHMLKCYGDILLPIIFFAGMLMGWETIFCSGYQRKGKSSHGVGSIEAGISTTARVWYLFLMNLIFLNRILLRVF